MHQATVAHCPCWKHVNTAKGEIQRNPDLFIFLLAFASFWLLVILGAEYIIKQITLEQRTENQLVNKTALII